VTKNSKFLSYVLRHNPGAIGLHVDDEGWVPVDDLLAALAAHGRPLSPDQLEQLIVGTDKQRFETRDGRIRAAQGHSIHVDLGLTPVAPPDLLFHGTVERFLPRIKDEGLLPMSRNVVHLSTDPATARTVGARRGLPIVLKVEASAMYRAGHLFFRAANGVWLTGNVPPRYLTAPP
jgi:putative RNA 2'-phosphotransferase